jgi:alpha-L-fucosidase 2
MSDTSMRLKMETPAKGWRDALPCGNGVTGALVYGRIVKERILLNHEAFWSNGSIPPVPNTAGRLPELRSMLAAGRFFDAEKFFPALWENDGFEGSASHFLPGPDVRMEYHPKYPFEQYASEVDMLTGEVTTRWAENGYVLRRRVFVSRPDNLLVIQFETENPKGLDVLLSIAAHDPVDSVEYSGYGGTGAPEETLSVDPAGVKLAAVFEDGAAYDAELKVFGAPVVRERAGLRVQGAQSFIALVQMTPRNNSLRVMPSRWPDLPDYEAMRATHIEKHSELMRRQSFSLCSESDSSNERMLLDAASGPVAPALAEKLFNYGRYLLVSSSTGDAVYPAHLQGLWNGDYRPAWCCGIFNNENVEMNYWGALSGSLPEALLPLFNVIESRMDDFRENAERMYGCRGILLPLFMSPQSGRKHNPRPHMIYWTAGAGWIAQSFFDYYLYTDDTEFLKNRALPFMQEAARFYEDFFTENEHGQWESSPSCSPENCPNGDFEGAGTLSVSANALMDFAVAKELFTNLIGASEKLNLNEENLARWRSFLEKIPPYEVNADGAVSEWMDSRFEDNYHHRHQSHLYPLFPGREICSVREPELFEACRVAVEKRLVLGLEQQTGWSLVHMALVYARLKEGDLALECLRFLTRSCLGKNFFTYHNSDLDMGITQPLIQGGLPAPFQIEANLGIVAAVLEMLVFCRPGLIHLLPALPGSWTKGSICGVQCMGGIKLNLKWDRLLDDVSVEISSKTDAEIALFLGRNSTQVGVQVKAGEPLNLKMDWSRFENRPDVCCLV